MSLYTDFKKQLSALEANEIRDVYRKHPGKRIDILHFVTDFLIDVFSDKKGMPLREYTEMRKKRCDMIFFFEEFYKSNYDKNEVLNEFIDWNSHEIDKDRHEFDQWFWETYYECECTGIKISYGDCKCDTVGGRERYNPRGYVKFEDPKTSYYSTTWD